MTGLLYQSTRFAAAGIVNTAVGLAAIYAAMFFLQVPPAGANAVGYAIGFAVSFALNRSWTFGSTRPWSRELPKYLLVVAVSYLLNLMAVVAATSRYSGNAYLAQVLGVCIYTVCAFFGCRWFVFAAEQPT